MTHLVPVLAFAALLAPAPTVGDLAPDSTTVERWYEALRELEPDPSRGAVVEELTLVGDVGRFELVSGTLHLLDPVDGRTFGAVRFKPFEAVLAETKTEDWKE